MINNIVNEIEPLNGEMMKKTREKVDSLAKPLGSLGKLEDIVVKLSGITGQMYNDINKKGIIIMSADNGVVEEGVGSAPQYVTLAQTRNFIKGKTGVASLAKTNNTDLIVIDVGINSDEEIEGVINKKIRKGTNNLYKEPAMSRDEAIKAINIGIEAAKNAKDNGYSIIGVGEMGIGNTTTSSAILLAMIDCKLEDVVGKGGGITSDSFEKKKKIVKESLEINKVNPDDPIDVLSKVGGFDIAAMAGVFLGCAYYRLPVVVDGFISAVSALVASRINPMVKEFLFSSHKSLEIGYNVIMEELELDPMLDLNMRLGEGSGCPMAFSIVEFAISMLKNMSTFKQADIDDSYIDKIRGEENYIV